MTESTNSDEIRDLYRELILDHARSPRHFGRLEQPTHTAEGINPLCGDKLRLELALDGGDRIVDAAFEGTGCAISMASASLLTESVIGLCRTDAEQWFRRVTARLAGHADDDAAQDLGKLAALEGVKEFPSRVKCATLAWHALHSALDGGATTVSTE